MTLWILSALVLDGARGAEVVEFYVGENFGRHPPHWVVLDDHGDPVDTRTFVAQVGSSDLQRAWRAHYRGPRTWGMAGTAAGAAIAGSGLATVAASAIAMRRPENDTALPVGFVGAFGCLVGVVVTGAGTASLGRAARAARDPSAWLTADEARRWLRDEAVPTTTTDP